MIEEFRKRFELRDGRLYSLNRQAFVVGGLDSVGYPTTSMSGKPVRIHRIVFALTHGYLPKYIDHIDRDKTNNAPDNLRACTQQENTRNCGLRKHSTTGVKGVGRNASGTYYAYVNTASGRKRGKATRCLETARQDRKDLEEKYYGL